jgi:hypothetical protein
MPETVNLISRHSPLSLISIQAFLTKRSQNSFSDRNWKPKVMHNRLFLNPWAPYRGNPLRPQAGCAALPCPVVGHLAQPLGYLERAVSVPARPASSVLLEQGVS